MPATTYSRREKARGKALGRVIQDARKAAGKSQAELARLSKVDLDTLRGIEQGRRASPSVFNVAALAAALGASMDTWITSSRRRRARRRS